MQNKKTNPWSWIPTLYFAEGLPYVIVMTVSVIMYKRLGISNEEIGLYTSLLYLPWVVKPLWSPAVDVKSTKRNWVIFTQLILAFSFFGIAVVLNTSSFFILSLVFLWLTALSSATHDIAADGFYMLGLSQKDQSFFVGIRSTFYRFAMIAGQGLLVVAAGWLEGGNNASKDEVQFAWSVTFVIAAALFIAFAGWHKLIMPKPINDKPAAKGNGNAVKNYFASFVEFFKKPGIGLSIAYLLIYRLGEAQLSKMIGPFLLDSREAGGLGLTTEDVGFAYGTVGIIGLVAGGILGGVLTSRDGLKKWIWIMVAAINLPNFVYLYLSVFQPGSIIIITSLITIEQFGYGLGFAAYMLYMIYISEGEFKTSHFALCTGFMALGMMLPGMISGYMQQWLGYEMFFLWVILSTLPAFIVTAFLKIDPSFGKKGT